MLRRLADSQLFALIDFLLVLISGAVWMIWPELGPGVILIALLPWLIRAMAGKFPFQQTSADWLVFLFLLTAWVGYWAAYDKPAAWNKAWFIVLAVLLYYALVAQPGQNRAAISYILFGMGVGISMYYLLTHDFTAVPRKLDIVNRLGGWIMKVRPPAMWAAIHPNYVAGVAALTVPFIFYPLWKHVENKTRLSLPLILWVGAGLAVAGFALIMATSRGVVLAIVSGAGAVLLGKLIQANKSLPMTKKGDILTAVLLFYLCVVVAILYLGPAQSAGGVDGSSYYGNGSRAELFSRSLYLLGDFPITGGGLASFPGLFSQYILNIPFFYFPNSHNLFLDVAIEQGLPGGLVFLSLYLVSLRTVSGRIAAERSRSLFAWIVLFSLVAAMVHGLVDNYLYNGVGSLLSLLLVGLSMNGTIHQKIQAGSGLPASMAWIVVLSVLIAFVAFLYPLRSAWYANLGAVQLSKVELDDFPSSSWDSSRNLPSLGGPAAAFQASLQLNPANRTANHRLGLIAMMQGDYESAAGYLEAAWKVAPEHRGIVKSLGYCYTWLGDLDKAQPLLERIPEAKSELVVYIWWWDTQGRSDLSAQAVEMTSRLKNAEVQ